MGKQLPLTALSENGDIVASVVRGNRMKWWRRDPDAKLAEIYGFVGKNVIYTTLCFARVAAGNSEVVVAGTADGRIEVFDLAGVQISSSKPFESLGHKGFVSSLSSTKPSSSRPGSVFASSEQCPSVVEVSLNDGSLRSSFKADKIGVRRVVVTDEYIITASSSKLKAYTFDHECIAKYAIGAMRGVTSLCCSGTTVCASDGSGICVWNIKTNVSTPVKGSFAKEGKLECLHFSVCGRWLVGRVAAFVHIWRVDEKEFKQRRRITTTDRILALRLCEVGLVSVLGDWKSPRFDSFDVITGEFHVPRKADLGGKENCVSKQPVAIGVQSSVKKRLRSSETETDKDLKRIVAKRQKLWEEEKNVLKSGAVSYTAVINQWYKTGDTRDLEACYRINSHPIIRRTVQDLAAPVAWKFLIECGNKLMVYPFLVHSLSSWARQIFHDHAAYILSQGPEKKRLLLPLQTYLQQRITSGELLHTLQGKLELLSYLAENRIVARNENDAKLNQAALVEYKEGDEDIADALDTAEGESDEEEEDDVEGFNLDDIGDDDIDAICDLDS